MSTVLRFGSENRGLTYGHDGLIENIDCLRGVVDFNKYTHSQLSEFMPLTRSFFFKYPNNFCLLSQSSFRLLRILDVCITTSIFYSFESISELVHLRYLACPSYDGLVRSICNLRNIQTIAIHGKSPPDMFIRTPPLAWKVLDMPQLRHIHTKNFSLLIPPPTSLIAVRENHLQTLTGLMPSSCNAELFQRIPNLKKLGILNVDSVDTEKCYFLDNLVHLTQLEKLKVKFEMDFMYILRLWRTEDRVYTRRLYIPHSDDFPPKLKKLTLCKTHLQWEDMNFLRKLPNLQQWEATSYHFPSLEHLVLTDCYSLEQIPFDFADIQTLQLIELHKCMHSVLVSAEQIQEEQQSLGNDDLVIRVNNIRE
ncbi:hypothetical protein T459_21223 [Capsicum annuum]|uniref:Disease resistance R13L4/SHOC-2-like LRR domain-containing protein n=1 Tax=Capsicum annuum TaxID=4072 RepID=A0A2G2YW25_CAPAN|nr:hypothetical protein T459_21223 [Capsicum annuum]